MKKASLFKNLNNLPCTTSKEVDDDMKSVTNDYDNTDPTDVPQTFTQEFGTFVEPYQNLALIDYSKIEFFY